jgi:hypothetical protein
MSRNHLLSRTDNRLEDFEANGRGELTPEQMDRLKGLILPASPQEAQYRQYIAQSRRNIKLMAISALGLLVMASLLFVIGNTLARGATPLIGTLAGLAMLGSAGHYAAEQYYRYRLRTMRDTRERTNDPFKSILAAPSSAIHRIEGEVTLKSGTSTGGHRVYIGLQSFLVADDLWHQLRRGGQRVVAHFLETRQYDNLLLSVQRVDDLVPLPIDDVVGISDDGEIIYQQDLEDGVPDGEVRPLKKSDSNTTR